MNWFICFISFLIILRLAELIVSRQNEKWLLRNGAVEYGKGHYPYIVLLHVFFIASLITEYYLRPTVYLNLWFLALYLLLIILKVWVIASLGKYWNTKIYRVPNALLIKGGPYKFIKHPNYIIVIGEIAVIPLIFHLYYTDVIFSILNAVMLSIRIREENKALAA